MFSVISTLLTLNELILWNYLHIYLFESQVHVNSKMNVIILLEYFNLFNCGLVHMGLPSWYTNKSRYRSNKRDLFHDC